MAQAMLDNLDAGAVQRALVVAVRVDTAPAKGGVAKGACGGASHGRLGVPIATLSSLLGGATPLPAMPALGLAAAERSSTRAAASGSGGGARGGTPSAQPVGIELDARTLSHSAASSGSAGSASASNSASSSPGRVLGGRSSPALRNSPLGSPTRSSPLPSPGPTRV